MTKKTAKDIPNTEVINLIETMIQPLVVKVEKHDDQLRDILPQVENHQKLLHGDPDDRIDQGIIGVINKLEELVATAKSWLKPIAISILGAALMSIFKTGFEIYQAFLLMP